MPVSDKHSDILMNPRPSRLLLTLKYSRPQKRVCKPKVFSWSSLISLYKTALFTWTVNHHLLLLDDAFLLVTK